jgi:ribosomal protein L9
MPPGFLSSGGLGDAIQILKDYNRQLLAESNKAKEIETEIIAQLTGLRSDLQQKIKEIKSLSGDFKSSVEKEQEATKRAVRAFQEALGSVDHDSAVSSGKGDPFIVKMGVDRQVERQIDEENYLHRVCSLRLVSRPVNKLTLPGLFKSRIFWARA